MSADQLAAVIYMICLKYTGSDKLTCFDKYVNCGVRAAGSILTDQEFIDKCLLKKERETL